MRVSFSRRFLVRVAAFLLAIVCVAGALAWFFALPLEARYYVRRLPVLRQIPTSVQDSAFTESTGRKITFCGSAFDVPWSDLDETKTKTGGNSTILYFDSGLVVVLKCLPPREFVEGVLSSIKVNSTIFRQAFGESAVRSDYRLWRLILETTPDAMTLRTPHRRQGAIMAMLVLKAMATPPADSGIFAIHNDEFDGFQYQDPHASPKSVLMDLFAEDRGLEFVFFYKGASPHLSQADINRIVRTIRRFGPYPPIKQASLTQPR
jgi:hypothetical protein